MVDGKQFFDQLVAEKARLIETKEDQSLSKETRNNMKGRLFKLNALLRVLEMYLKDVPNE